MAIAGVIGSRVDHQLDVPSLLGVSRIALDLTRNDPQGALNLACVAESSERIGNRGLDLRLLWIDLQMNSLRLRIA